MIVVIGGGGLKPLSALPILEFLRENKVPIDRLIATSGGALAGAYFAMNRSNAHTEKDVKYTSKKKPFYLPQFANLLGMMKLPFFNFKHEKGMLSSKPLLKIFDHIFGDRTIEDLSIPLSILTTDLNSGEEVYLESGLLKKAVYASSTIYPFMEALHYNGQTLVDGGYNSAIPVKKGLSYKPDHIFIISFNFKPDLHPPTIFHHFNNFYCMSLENKALALMQSQLKTYTGEVTHIKINFKKRVKLYSTKEIPNILEFGKSVLEDNKEWIQKKLSL